MDESENKQLVVIDQLFLQQAEQDVGDEIRTRTCDVTGKTTEQFVRTRWVAANEKGHLYLESLARTSSHRKVYSDAVGLVFTLSEEAILEQQEKNQTSKGLLIVAAIIITILAFLGGSSAGDAESSIGAGCMVGVIAVMVIYIFATKRPHQPAYSGQQTSHSPKREMSWEVVISMGEKVAQARASKMGRKIVWHEFDFQRGVRDYNWLIFM